MIKTPTIHKESKVKDTWGNPATKYTTKDSTISDDRSASFHSRDIRIIPDHATDIVDKEKSYTYVVTNSSNRPDDIDIPLHDRGGESKIYASLGKAEAILERAALSEQFRDDDSVSWVILRETVTIYRDEDDKRWIRTRNHPIATRPEGSRTVAGWAIYWG